ncbi:MAG: hypothetical protein VYC39_02305 [Myxococcota bacterium]|nr:hypothetical protein [Myxococcota bacterium]
MKVPKKGLPPPTPPPKGGRPKGLTKRTVKGAAGGMLGVDYEDTRRPDPFLTRGDSSLSEDGPDQRQALRGEGDGEGSVAISYRNADASKDHRPDRSAFSDNGKDQDSGDLTARTKQRKKIKKLRHSKESDEEQQSGHEESSETFEDRFEEFDSADAAQISDRPRSKYFDEDELGQPGDLNLVNPDTIQRRLGSPMAYAKHVMILAEAFRKNTGATRKEAISYMASMFLSLTDTRFGWSALKEFGHGTGIIDIYPLEVIEEIMNKYPGHLPKISFGRIFTASEKQDEVLRTDTDTPLMLSYPEELKIRSFALKGGGVPGYTFEPAKDIGTYKLHLRAPGRFNILIASLNRAGFSLIEALTIVVSPAKNYYAGESVEIQYPPRDEKKVDAWPKPELELPKPIVSAEGMTPTTEQSLTLMSSADLIHFKAMSALTGPKGGATDYENPDNSQPKAFAPNEPPSDAIKPLPAIHSQNNELPSKMNTSTKNTLAGSAEYPEEGELTTADKDALRGVIDEIFEPRSRDIGNYTETASTQEEQIGSTTLTKNLDHEQHFQNSKNNSGPRVYEEHEEPSGEATEPLNQDDLAWIFEDPDG